MYSFSVIVTFFLIASINAAPYPPVVYSSPVVSVPVVKAVHPVVPVVKYSAPVVSSSHSSSVIHHAPAPYVAHPTVVKTYVAPAPVVPVVPVHSSYSSQNLYKAPKSNLVVAHAPVVPIVPVVKPAVYYH